jgi:molybdopterin-guanine dinucleotide biosynthesis protein A
MTKTAYILAGGKSQRMGQDKLFLKLSDRTILSHMMEICLSEFETVKLVAKQATKFKSIDADVVFDYPNITGPMAGVIAALLDCREETCFVTAADLYDLNLETIQKLKKEYSGEQYLGISEESGSQPLCGIYHRSALTALKSMASKKNYQMRNAVSHMRHRLILPDVILWRNINTPEHYASLEGNDV